VDNAPQQPAEREALAKRVLAMSSADQTEVLINQADAALTRFTHEVSNQNLAAQNVGLSVRAVVDRRTGVAQTNRLDDDSLRATVARALEMAKLSPPDPLTPQLPGHSPVTAVGAAFDRTTADANASVRAGLCAPVFEAAESSGCWSAGYASTSSGGITVANTSGALASFDGTDAALNVKMTAPDSTGFAESYAAAVGSIDAAAVARTAAGKALGTAAPAAVDPGEWTVVLEPAAFGELLMYVANHFSAQSFDDGSSFFSDGLGRAYFSDTFTLLDDFAHPLSPGMPFDYEGHPTQRLALVENGVVKAIVTDSYYAKKLDRSNTGHALPAPNAYGPQARNLVVAAGIKSTEQLIAETKRGLLISRFWYIRTVDRKRAIVTGMTRDGTFAIENGRVARGVRNLRFNVGIVDLLGRCEISSEQRRTGSYHYSLVAPAAKFEKFAFTSVADF
jgi:PmbA protein